MTSNDAFIEADKFRKAVFTSIVAGESDPKRIAKKNRLIPQAVDRAVEDLEEHELITDAGDGDGYELTEKGERYAAERRNLQQ